MASSKEDIDNDTLRSVDSNRGAEEDGQPRSLYEDADSIATVEDRDNASRVYSNIVSRTTSVIEAVRDENHLTHELSKNIIPLEPFEVLLGEKHLQNSQSHELIEKQIGMMDLGSSPNLTEDGQGKHEKGNTGEYNDDDLKDLPPDGTFWGWTATVCNMLINACSWGANSSFSVFLNYYLESDVFKGATAEDYALVGGLTLGVTFIVCPFAVLLCKKYPLKWILTTGMVIEVCCYVFGSFSKTYAQLLITQGLLLSIGYALVAGPTFLILPGWFLKKRSIAQGITTAGAGVGGLLFSRSSNAIIERSGGFPWALRMIGLVSALVLTVSIILVRPRKPFHSRDASLRKELKSVINLETSCSPPILYISWWFFFYSFGYSILLFSLSAFATSIGLTQAQGAIIVTIQGCAQCIGRPLCGILSDITGRVNFSLLGCIIVGIITLVFWPNVTTYAQLIGFTLLASTIMGVHWVNFSPLAADAVGSNRFPAAFTSIFFFGGLPSVVAEVIGLKLRDESSAHPFWWCQVFVGVTTFVGLLSLFPLREWKINNMIGARRESIMIKLKEGSGDLNSLTPNEQQRLHRYDYLLGKGIVKYTLRMFYPVKA